MRPTPSQRFFLLAPLLLLPACAHSHSPRHHPLPPSLIRRQSDTCSDPASVRCPNVTEEFCCPPTAECIPLESATSVICCNADDFCDEIHPVACPAADASAQLDKCGASCCPVGFECSAEKDKCLMKEANLPESYKKKHEEESGLKDENIALCRQVLGEESTTSSNCKAIPGKAVAVGLFPGMVLGAAVMFALTRLREMRTRRRSIKSFGPRSFPDQGQMDDDISEKSVPLPDHPWRLELNPPGSAGFSPNLGPVIEPARDRSKLGMRGDGECDSADRSRASSIQRGDVGIWDNAENRGRPENRGPPQNPFVD